LDEDGVIEGSFYVEAAPRERMDFHFRGHFSYDHHGERIDAIYADEDKYRLRQMVLNLGMLAAKLDKAGLTLEERELLYTGGIGWIRDGQCAVSGIYLTRKTPSKESARKLLLGEIYVDTYLFNRLGMLKSVRKIFDMGYKSGGGITASEALSLESILETRSAI
jgi:hypothetical protein